MTLDAKQLSRTAQRAYVEVAPATGSPPVHGDFIPLYGAKVDRIELNTAATPSKVTIWFPSIHWDRQDDILKYGDKVRITIGREIIFMGFIVNYISDFSGGSARSGSAFERLAKVAYDYTWLLSVTSPVSGQFARSPDDYSDFGGEGQSPLNSWTCLNGRRVIFNQNKKPNKDLHEVTFDNKSSPLFGPADNGYYWCVGDMLRYVLNYYNSAIGYLDFGDPLSLPGFNNADFDKILMDVCIDGLSVIEALDLITKSIGWTFRFDYDSGSPKLVFYKPGSASNYTRTDSSPVILHKLHAPAAGENISAAVASGSKMLWSMELAEDIGMVVNEPIGLGAPQKFEFTAELVPAWLDSDLSPDVDNLYLTDAELQDETNPDVFDFYKYYYPRGSAFKRDVGRRFSLNESGRYTSAARGDRGIPFDFATVIPAKYILSDTGKRLYAPFNRFFLPALTVAKDTKNSIGIKVEFSFDSGDTWQTVNASISSLSDECGIYIDEPNLAEIADKNEAKISGGTLDGEAMNLWTSLCDDKLNSRSFKAGDWHTRVRVTASVQLDQRLLSWAGREPTSGSPFHQSQIYDLSGRYGLQKRTASSIFDASDLPAWEIDSSDYFDSHLQALRRSCKDASVSGKFTLDRLWPNTFKCGDCIEYITGRNYSLAAGMGQSTVFPEIIRITILPKRQREVLVTRDLRFAEVTMI